MARIKYIGKKKKINIFGFVLSNKTLVETIPRPKEIIDRLRKNSQNWKGFDKFRNN